MNYIKTVLAVAVLFMGCVPAAQSQSAQEILQRVEDSIRATSTLSYTSAYTKTKAIDEEPESRASADIWLQRVPTDSIFAAYFRVDTEYEGKAYSYFYDGSNSYEATHETQRIIVFDPHSYPSAHMRDNRAKARVVLTPFVEWIIDENFVTSILEGDPELRLLEESRAWVIELKYPPNTYEQSVTRTIRISKEDYRITEISRLVESPSSLSVTYRFILSNIIRNDREILSSIGMDDSYREYSFASFETQKMSQFVDPKMDLVNREAPDFSYPTFSGQIVSLQQLRGKWVLLDFWESWCGFCIQAFPEILDIYESRGDKLEVIGVTTENFNEVEVLIRKNSLRFPNLKADREIVSRYDILGRPAYVLIDPEGMVVHRSHRIPDKVYELLE